MPVEISYNQLCISHPESQISALSTSLCGSFRAVNLTGTKAPLYPGKENPMIYKSIPVLVVLVVLSLGPTGLVDAETLDCSPGSNTDAMKCGPEGDSQAQFSALPVAPVGKSGNILALTAVPKVVFQINQAADAPAILGFVTNYLVAEPSASVAVVGYAGGIDFMLKGARDAGGKPYANQLQALAEKGVLFKACGNTLKQRKLAADALSPQVTEVPGAVNEIIRLQTREGYAYFRP
jgi:uncharacterized protein